MRVLGLATILVLTFGHSIALAGASPAPTSAPASMPTPPPTDRQPIATLDVEAGGANEFLNAGRGTWNQSYVQALYASPSGFKAYAAAENDVRFGFNDDTYGFGAYVPTKDPHGVFGIGYAFSPQHNVLPSSAWTANYDLRAGGGYGYQLSYAQRTYTTANASIWTAGADRYFGDQRLAYGATFARLSNAPGIAFSQTVSWSKYLRMDTITVNANIGRDVENTGNGQIAVYDTAGVDVDELHWLDSKTAIHVNVGYVALSNAYDRFGVLLGLRVRL